MVLAGYRLFGHCKFFYKDRVRHSTNASTGRLSRLCRASSRLCRATSPSPRSAHILFNELIGRVGRRLSSILKRVLRLACTPQTSGTAALHRDRAPLPLLGGSDREVCVRLLLCVSALACGSVVSCQLCWILFHLGLPPGAWWCGLDGSAAGDGTQASRHAGRDPVMHLTVVQAVPHPSLAPAELCFADASCGTDSDSCRVSFTFFLLACYSAPSGTRREQCSIVVILGKSC
jgi:hypothetical protein